ncbi:hypothetical protein DMUE_5903, partial [Dictyocoela muelleri]
MKCFIQKYTGRTLKTSKHYRTAVIDKVYTEKYNQVMDGLVGQDYYIMFDETTDVKGRYILNILVGICFEKQIETHKLVKTIELNKTNLNTVLAQIMSVALELAKGNILDSKLKLILSDMAGYALKACKMLKNIIPSVLHITCLANMLHLLCETIRKDSTLCDSLFSRIKHVLTKNKTNQRLFYEITELPLPKFPIITRWGTWIEFAIYLKENLQKISFFLVKLDDQKNSQYFKDVLENQIFILELNRIYSFRSLVKKIKFLESNQISTVSQLNIIKEVQEDVKEDFVLLERIMGLINKNPDLNFLLDLQRKNQMPELFKQIPLTTASVERSFSALTFILDDRRTHMTVDTLEKMLF